MPRYHLTYSTMKRADKKAAMINALQSAAIVITLSSIVMLIGLTQ